MRDVSLFLYPVSWAHTVPVVRVELIRRDKAVGQRRLDKGNPSGVSFNRCAVLPASGARVAGKSRGERGLARRVI